MTMWVIFMRHCVYLYLIYDCFLRHGVYTVCVYFVGVILPYEYGTFTAELILVLIVGFAAAMQIHFGILFAYLINCLLTYLII